jgi:hypothetical protein
VSIKAHQGDRRSISVPASGCVSCEIAEHMSTFQEQPQSGPGVDRRALGRTMINRDASMFFLGQDKVHACCVRDVTNRGAGLRLNGLNVLPFDFGISFDHFRTMRRCRLIWRDGDFVGAAFEN